MTQKSIGLQETTYEELAKIKKIGQSFDGVIQELLKVYKATKPN